VKAQKFFAQIFVLALLAALGGAVGIATLFSANAQGGVHDAVADMASADFRSVSVETSAEAEHVSDVDIVIVYDKSGSMEYDTLCYGCWEPISGTLYPDGNIYPLQWSTHTTATADHCASACGDSDYQIYDADYEVNDCNYRHRTYLDRTYTVIEAEEYSQVSVNYHDWGYTPYYTFWVIQRNGQGAYARDTRGAYLSHHPYGNYTNSTGLGVACTWDDLNSGENCRSGVTGGPFLAPRADYDFYAPRDADYYIWIRGQGGNSSENQHIFWGLDTGGTYILGQESDFPTGAYYDGARNDRWEWRRLSQGENGDQGDAVYLLAGNHTLHLWAGGAGFDADRFVITTDSDSSLPSSIQSMPPNDGRTDWACSPCDPRFAGRPGGQTPPEGPYRPDCNVGGNPDQRNDAIYDDEQCMRNTLEAAKQFVGWLNPRFDQVGYVPYSSDAETRSELQCVRRLGADECTPQVITDTVLYELDRTRAGGATNTADGMQLGTDVLSTEGSHYGRPGAAHAMILMTDGEANQQPNDYCDDEDLWPDGEGAKDCVVYYAREARDRGVVIYTISLGWSADRELMTYVAELTGGYHRWAPTSDRLDELFKELYERIFLRPALQKTASTATPVHGQTITYTIVVQSPAAPLTATVYHLTDEVPVGLSYVPGTLTTTAGTATDTAAPALRWSGTLTPTPVVTVTYAATVSATTPQAITNTAVITDSGRWAVTRQAIVTVQATGSPAKPSSPCRRPANQISPLPTRPPLPSTPAMASASPTPSPFTTPPAR